MPSSLEPLPAGGGDPRRRRRRPARGRWNSLPRACGELEDQLDPRAEALDQVRPELVERVDRVTGTLEVGYHPDPATPGRRPGATARVLAAPQRKRVLVVDHEPASTEPASPDLPPDRLPAQPRPERRQHRAFVLVDHDRPARAAAGPDRDRGAGRRAPRSHPLLSRLQADSVQDRHPIEVRQSADLVGPQPGRFERIAVVGNRLVGVRDGGPDPRVAPAGELLRRGEGQPRLRRRPGQHRCQPARPLPPSRAALCVRRAHSAPRAEAT